MGVSRNLLMSRKSFLRVRFYGPLDSSRNVYRRIAILSWSTTPISTRAKIKPNTGESSTFCLYAIAHLDVYGSMPYPLLKYTFCYCCCCAFTTVKIEGGDQSYCVSLCTVYFTTIRPVKLNWTVFVIVRRPGRL